MDVQYDYSMFIVPLDQQECVIGVWEGTAAVIWVDFSSKLVSVDTFQPAFHWAQMHLGESDPFQIFHWCTFAASGRYQSDSCSCVTVWRSDRDVCAEDIVSDRKPGLMIHRWLQRWGLGFVMVHVCDLFGCYCGRGPWQRGWTQGWMGVGSLVKPSPLQSWCDSGGLMFTRAPRTPKYDDPLARGPLPKISKQLCVSMYKFSFIQSKKVIKCDCIKTMSFVK